MRKIFYVIETNGTFCDHCEDGFVKFDAAEETTWLAFRDRVDAAEAAELARIRKKLKLTQIGSRATGRGRQKCLFPL